MVNLAPPVGVVNLAPPVGVVNLAPPVGVVNLASLAGVVNLASPNSWTNRIQTPTQLFGLSLRDFPVRVVREFCRLRVDG